MRNLPTLAAAAALLLLAPGVAQANDTPSYAQPAEADQQIQGRVSAFDGRYRLDVRDENGYQDNVVLHDGTIINPTGLTLAPGMAVRIFGYNAGSYFAANEVDTPYTLDVDVPVYEGVPWSYYGPDISLGFFFGDGDRWHHDRDFNRGGHYRGGGYPRSFGGRSSFRGGQVGGRGRR